MIPQKPYRRDFPIWVSAEGKPLVKFRLHGPSHPLAFGRRQVLLWQCKMNDGDDEFP